MVVVGTRSYDGPRLVRRLVGQDATRAGAPQRRIRGEGDRNIYNGLSSFWRSGDANSTVGRQNLSFDDWKAYWGSSEVQPSVWPITWKRQTAEQLPPNARTVADYT